MKIPKVLVRTMLAAGLLAGAPVFAGSFTTDFAPGSTGYTLAGGDVNPAGFLTNYLGINRAVLAMAITNSTGSVTLDDLDPGQAIESFVATFKLQIGPGSGNAADGVAFNFGPDIYAGQLTGEEGPGGTALSVTEPVGAQTTNTPIQLRLGARQNPSAQPHATLAPASLARLHSSL